MSSTPRTTQNWAALAREVIEHSVRGTDPSRTTPPVVEGAPPEHGGVFVTLRKRRRLRGCMGSLDTSLSLADAVRSAARAAAAEDPRFPPVAIGELADVSISVSILSRPRPMRSIEELRIGTHGILVRRGVARGLFLPQVAVEHGLDPVSFVSRCCKEKAGLNADAWRQPDSEVLLFTTSVHESPPPSDA